MKKNAIHIALQFVDIFLLILRNQHISGSTKHMGPKYAMYCATIVEL